MRRTPSVVDSRRVSTERPVAGWMRVVAHAIPLVVLPSALWRLAFAADLMPRPENAEPKGAFILYLIFLTVGSEALALLSLGLVRPWGEVFPRWLPRIGGRPVPLGVIVVPAVGALLLTLLWSYGLLHVWQNLPARNGEPAPTGAGLIWIKIAYTPLLLWGPLLGALTVGYYVRRRPHTHGR